MSGTPRQPAAKTLPSVGITIDALRDAHDFASALSAIEGHPWGARPVDALIASINRVVADLVAMRNAATVEANATRAAGCNCADCHYKAAGLDEVGREP